MGGRAKGTPNNKTKEVRTFISDLLKNKMADIEEAFDQLEAKDKVAAFTQLVKYVIPSLQSVDIDAVVEKKGDSIEDKLRELAEEE